MNYNEQVTMLGSLPHLEEMSPMRGGAQHPSAPSDESIRKTLRQNHQPLPQSGMYTTETGAAYSPLPSSMEPPRAAFYSPAYHPMDIETYTGATSTPTPTCVDIHGHVKNCPICTHFYGSSERLFYIIALIILTVVCLLLLKKIIDDKH